MSMKFRLVTCVLMGLFLLSATAFAKPAFMKQHAAYYEGSAPTCATRHGTPPGLNSYGTALRGALKGGKALTPAIFKASAAKAPKS